MDDTLPTASDLPPDADTDSDDTVTADLGDQGAMTVGDVDRDGRAEWVEVVAPDGSRATVMDRDGSGSFETLTEDRDADQLVDRVTTDLNEDAIGDVVQEDQDRDGVLESISLTESGTTVRIDPDTGLVVGLEDGLATSPAMSDLPLPGAPSLDAAPATDDATETAATEEAEAPVDARTSDVAVDDELHGDPAAELRWAQVQSENGFCVPVSVAMIVSEFTGVAHAESEMVEAAIELNVLFGEPGAWVGMTTEGTVELLDRFGVESHVEYGNIDDLRGYLDDNRGIVLMVDADELWSGAADDVQLGDLGADHAVVITGIDDERAVITLNDPGQEGGEGWEITIADFMDAWDDSNYEMVVTDEAPETREALRGSLSAIRHPGGYVMLPVVVGNEVLRRPDRPFRLGEE